MAIAPPDMTENPYKATDAGDPHLQYRTMSRAAVGSVAMFLLGLTGLMFWQLLILPIAGLLLGYSAIRSIRRYPDEYTGLNLAKVGMTLCLILLVGGGTMHAYIIATEVPEGCTPVYWSELQPEGFAAMQHLPKRAIDLRGKRIFIKGYMHPGVSGMGKVNQFVLVPDFGTCCFGGQPKPTDMILVHTTPDARQSYGMSAHMIKLAGDFDIGDHAEEFAGVKNVVYRMEADYSR